MKDPIRVTTLTRIWKDFSRQIRPSEWVVWLLGLKRTDANTTDRGLIIVQIDGLSKTQMTRGVAEGRMPFLRSLMEKEGFFNHDFYSGLPSNTAAGQGELYYGIRTVVPACGFRDHDTGHLVRMFGKEIARDVEREISQGKTGLLAGGGSFCNIYSGGADEVHFCATSSGWDAFFNTLNPFKLLLVVLLNFWMFIRVVGWMVVELILASFDFVRGILPGKRLWRELIMIPARVIVVVLLRDLATVGACYDSGRGLPIIHLNLLGYDEQAHRRGPESKLAHWTLRGIDASIRRIWKAAHRGAGREYDVWVFSDHGQETTQPYHLKHGKLIHQVVAEMVEGCYPDHAVDEASLPYNRLPSRANWLGIGWLASMLFGEQDHDGQARFSKVQTVTSGPIGFIYLLNEKVKLRREEFAKRLVVECNVPMALVSKDGHLVEVFTSDGEFILPRDAAKVFGADHPFLEDIANDMVGLVNHKNAGDIVVLGWKLDCESTSFVLQNGAHAGPGIEETRGFSLLPADTVLPATKRKYLRPDDLRIAALRFLGRDSGSHVFQRPEPPINGRIRLMTYNVHACVGMDGQLSPERIARVIAQSGADIICLQELDVFRSRSGNRDQAHAIALFLEMSHQFHPAWYIEEEQFGNAILTRFPMRVIEAKSLHHHKADRSRRSALWVEIDINGEQSLQVINTHLSIYPGEQRIQAAQLLEEWVHPASLLGPVVLCGDFNARPNSATCKTFCDSMRDVESFDSNPTRSTLFSPFHVSRVDHILVTGELHATNNQVTQSRLARIASDHLPLFSDLSLNPSGVGCQ